jgi:hypothetical protein
LNCHAIVSVEFAELYVPVRPGAPTKVTDAYVCVVAPGKYRKVIPAVGATLKETDKVVFVNVAVPVLDPEVFEAVRVPANIEVVPLYEWFRLPKASVPVPILVSPPLLPSFENATAKVMVAPLKTEMLAPPLFTTKFQVTPVMGTVSGSCRLAPLSKSSVPPLKLMVLVCVRPEAGVLLVI